jgi:hypothetical protein
VLWYEEEDQHRGRGAADQLYRGFYHLPPTYALCAVEQTVLNTSFSCNNRTLLPAKHGALEALLNITGRPGVDDPWKQFTTSAPLLLYCTWHPPAFSTHTCYQITKKWMKTKKSLHVIGCDQGGAQ